VRRTPAEAWNGGGRANIPERITFWRCQREGHRRSGLVVVHDGIPLTAIELDKCPGFSVIRAEDEGAY
jgi:hypothetical protein